MEGVFKSGKHISLHLLESVRVLREVVSYTATLLSHLRNFAFVVGARVVMSTRRGARLALS
jgi:hypothetical protein